MSLHELAPEKGTLKAKRRLGRGPGSGRGKTAGRGHKGAKSRSGYSRRRGFEGGQMPLVRRVPKRGFTNIFSKDVETVNVSDLAKLPEGTVVTPDVLVQHRLIRRHFDRVKVLGNGEIATKLVVRVHAFSKSAKSKIEAAGGSAEELKA